MGQYRAVVVQANERYMLWYRYVQSRGLLNLAVKWSTTDPRASASPAVAARAVDIESGILGDELVKLVNGVRLKGLPAASGASGVVFRENANGTVAGLIEALPSIVNAVGRRVDAILAEQLPENDLSGFDAYATNVSALRQINSTIKAYLDIDITIKPQDLDEITQAIRSLR